MIIKSFRAQNFRNIEECSLEFDEKVNILLGENAQGKTNAVEGIYLFARGKSFRRGDEKDLVRFGEEGFSLSICYEDKYGENKLDYAVFGKERRRRKNGYKITKASEMMGSFKAVLFCPDDLTLVKEGPENRRDFLNVAIAQCYPSYVGIYADYKKALENRNAILKNASKGLYYDEGELIVWSENLAEYASHIYLYRKEYLKKLEVYAKRFMADISDGKEEITLFYKSDIEESKEDIPRAVIKEKYKEIFTSSLRREMGAGVTLFGPHREDMVIYLNEKDSRIFSSQGQQRSCILSLKLGEAKMLGEAMGEPPLILLDDVMSELDSIRRDYILNSIGESQIFLTCCDNANVKPLREGKVFTVTGGKIKE